MCRIVWRYAQRFLGVLFTCSLCACHVTGERNVYSILSYGARGDGTTLNTDAIQNALDACGKTGGVVLVPPGVYKTGTIWLRSNTELRVSGRNLYYQYLTEVRRPDGTIYAAGDNSETGVYLCDVPNWDVVTGLWSVRFLSARSGTFELVSLGLGGLPPVCFLSNEKYWKTTK